MKSCHVQLHSLLSWTGSSLPLHTDWCVYTDSSLVSLHLGKNIIAQWLAGEQTQRQNSGFENQKEKRFCTKPALEQNILRGYGIRRESPSSSVQFLYKANVHCLIQFQELAGRPVKAVCNYFSGRNIPLLPKGFPLNAARRISAYAAALHVYPNLLGNLSGGNAIKEKWADMEFSEDWTRPAGWGEALSY